MDSVAISGTMRGNCAATRSVSVTVQGANMGLADRRMGVCGRPRARARSESRSRRRGAGSLALIARGGIIRAISGQTSHFSCLCQYKLDATGKCHVQFSSLVPDPLAPSLSYQGGRGRGKGEGVSLATAWAWQNGEPL